MRTIEQIRRARLAQLKEEFGTYARLNELLGRLVRDSTLSQIASPTTSKDMGSDMARRLEQVCGKEVGWMDNDPALDQFVIALRTASGVIADVKNTHEGESPENREISDRPGGATKETSDAGAGAGFARSPGSWSKEVNEPGEINFKKTPAASKRPGRPKGKK